MLHNFLVRYVEDCQAASGKEISGLPAYKNYATIIVLSAGRTLSHCGCKTINSKLRAKSIHQSTCHIPATFLALAGPLLCIAGLVIRHCPRPVYIGPEKTIMCLSFRGIHK